MSSVSQARRESYASKTLIGESAISQIAGNNIPASVPRPGEREFIGRLEALRGVAALMVAGGHSFSVVHPLGWQAGARSFALIFLNGFSAVTVFFVLSGLVLGRSLVRARSSFPLNTATFVVRRFFRIYPAFFMASVLIAGSILLFNSHIPTPAGVSTWFAHHWSEPISPAFLVKNLLFKVHDLNPPSWTLRTELACSCALPFVFLVCAWGVWSRATLLLMLITWSFFARGNLSEYLFMFQLGLLIPDAGPILIKTLNRGTFLVRWVAPVAWIALCTAFAVFPNHSSVAKLIAGVSAATFISALLYGPELPWFRFFDWAPTRLYGRISYSFYLYDMITLFFVSKLVLLFLPLQALVGFFILTSALLLVLSTLVTTPIAWLSYRFIEKPGIAFSKSVCNRIEAKYALRSDGIQRRPAP